MAVLDLRIIGVSMLAKPRQTKQSIRTPTVMFSTLLASTQSSLQTILTSYIKSVFAYGEVKMKDLRG
jgi:hypothetical protein